MNFKTFQTEQDWTTAVLKHIQTLNPKTIALSGGSTPKPIYQALSHTPFQQTAHFFQVDERYIPNTHPHSNQNMIRQTLNPKNLHTFNTSLPIKQSLQNYATLLPEKLDLIILGIGQDGHTASIFPNTPALTTIHNKTAHTQTNQFHIKDRLTLTMPYILKAPHLIILLKDKPNIQKTLKDPSLPAYHLKDKGLFFDW